MTDWTPQDLGVPHADDLRSPIYDLREWLEGFPSHPEPLTPHVRNITADSVTSAWYDSEGGQVAPTFNVPENAPQPPGVYYDTEWDEGQKPIADRYRSQIPCPQCGKLNPDAEGNLFEQRCIYCGANMEGGIPQYNPGWQPSAEQHNEANRQLAWHDDDGNPLTQMMQGDVLSNGIKPLGGGMNETYTGWIDGDGKAVIKPKNAEPDWNVRNSITPGGDAEREYAAYLMSHSLDLPGARVPTTRLGQVQFPTELHTPPMQPLPPYGETADWTDDGQGMESWEHPDLNPAQLESLRERRFRRREPIESPHKYSGNASLQHFVAGGYNYDEPNNIPLDQRRNLGILDSLIGNHDRHGRNGMISYPDDSGVPHHFPIDHGLSFPDRWVHQGHSNADITDHFWQNQAPDQPPIVGGHGPYLTDEEKQHVQNKILNNPELWRRLHQVVGPLATDLAQKRAQYMVDKGHMLNNEKMTEAHAGGDDPHKIAPFYGMSPWAYAEVHGKPLSGIKECDRCNNEYDGKLGPLDEDGGKTMGRENLCYYCFGHEYPKEWEKIQRKHEEAPDWVAKPFVPPSSQNPSGVIE